mmetsp:Transcript_123390/g.245658  ORF Transcript_123390/g.245658 Transcript_123390/m.245658 type:complete len:185 (-) Transcript_123390:135-689(-)|eukprot:CAMPEP_0172721870 /NCGR_PEP_ID=MMETSP1074-20121228/80085_1 /TAXON_ID=2916 /ORGANISM="Ceratium fusus, Strain PA161109" /LENGTH=184 /DNA_ID=CAMNT_0013547727 /DNA_START=121 /DNA_END=675 /DNA_ORIENTATION=+
MGADSSAFCSAARANGYVAHDVPIMASCTPHPNKYSRQQMELGNSSNPNLERVDPWTRDLSSSPGLSTCACGSTTTAPRGYLADTQGNGSIVLDSKEGPMFVDDDKDSRPVHLHPDESNESQPLLVNATKPGAIQALRDKAVREGKIDVEGSLDRRARSSFLQDMCHDAVKADSSGAALPSNAR